jgi:hypothetical protein
MDSPISTDGDIRKVYIWRKALHMRCTNKLNIWRKVLLSTTKGYSWCSNDEANKQRVDKHVRRESQRDVYCTDAQKSPAASLLSLALG